ncbi:MAG: DoxX family membrane protein [Anaerolineae bacterium]|nr:DoxX family membrane protein [Anaerolineae bacterium]
MERAVQLFKAVDVKITRWMARYSVPILRIGLGIVFLWFGVLKFFPNLSPAEDLATRTIATLTFGLVQPQLSLPLLATLETVIGLGLITGKFMRVTLLLLLFQMLGTVTPLFLFPSETFTHFPYAPTLEGQYIIKNIVLVAAGLVIGATVRGGAVIADPEAVKAANKAIKLSETAAD